MQECAHPRKGVSVCFEPVLVLLCVCVRACVRVRARVGVCVCVRGESVNVISRAVNPRQS